MTTFFPSSSITVPQTNSTKKGKPGHKYIGVSYHTRSGKYDANAWNRSKNRQEFLGSFDSPEMGAIARDLFVYHLHTIEKQVSVYVCESREWETHQFFFKLIVATTIITTKSTFAIILFLFQDTNQPSSEFSSPPESPKVPQRRKSMRKSMTHDPSYYPAVILAFAAETSTSGLLHCLRNKVETPAVGFDRGLRVMSTLGLT